MRISVLGSAAVAVALVFSSVQAADATTPHYANCTKMHAKYKGSIARAGARDHRTGGGHARYKPYVNTPYYKANISMDRDKDGIACEQ